MQSKTSFFNVTLAKKDLTRFWPLWAVYLAVWVLALPVTQFLSLFGRNSWYDDSVDRLWYAAQSAAGYVGELATVMAVLFGCLFAMALCSYMMSARSVGFFHTLPIRREGLFITNYLTGAAAFTAIHGVVTLATAAIWAAAGLGRMDILGELFLSATGQTLFFYSFAVFCGVFAGQILALPVFYGVLNGLAMGLSWLISTLGELFLYGYERNGFPALVDWLTPAYQLAGNVGYDFEYIYHSAGGGVFNVEGALETLRVYGLGTVGIYALAGLAFAAAALAVYRTRRSESSGDTVAIGWARPVFRYGVGVCAGLALGELLYALVWIQFSDRVSAVAMAVCMVIGGLVGYFAAEMLLQKSFRVLKKSWKGALALSAALIALTAGCAADVLGIEDRVPETADVESVSYDLGSSYYVSSSTEDPALIERFIALHQALLDERDLAAAAQEQTADETVDVVDNWLGVTYYLKDGSSFRRSYTVVDAGEQAELFRALSADPAVQRANLLPDLEGKRITGGGIDGYAGDQWIQYSFDAAEAQIVYDAVVRDIDAGHFGRTALMPYTEYEKAAYANDLSLYGVDKDGNSGSAYIQFSVYCTETVAALKEIGALDTVTLQTRDGMVAAYETAAAGIAVIGGADGPTAILAAEAAG